MFKSVILVRLLVSVIILRLVRLEGIVILVSVK